jgi:hypothetical protein
MPGINPAETRLRWISWGLAVLLAASIWAFGIWARLTDGNTVFAAFPFVVASQVAAAIVLVGLLVVIRRMGTTEAQSPDAKV